MQLKSEIDDLHAQVEHVSKNKVSWLEIDMRY
jgi:hypothetical protein